MMRARNQLWFVLQDAGGDVVAVAGSMSSGLPVSVAGQYTYNAYGEVQTTDHLAEHPLMHAGHKGLFFDRLDVPLVATGGTMRGSGGGGELPRLVPYASGLYQMRNRAYSPQTGRFMQRDPNATSMVLIETASMHGRGIGAAVAALSPDGMYGDGHNLYQYLGSNPMSRRDPLGLSWDPFMMIDEYINASQDGAAEFISGVMDGLTSAASVAAVLMQYLPFPGAALAGEIAYAIINGEDLTPIIARAALGLIPGGKALITAIELAESAYDIVRQRSNPNENPEDAEPYVDESGGASDEDNAQRMAGSFRANGLDRLRKLGMGSFNLARKSYNAGRKKLEQAGWRITKADNPDKVVFSKGNSEIWYHRDKWNGRGDKHWHIVWDGNDKAKSRLNRTGRPVDRNSGGSHIPARRRR